MNIVVFYGSYRPARKGIDVANWVVSKLKERNHNVTFLDAKEISVPFLDKRYKEYEPGTAPGWMENMASAIKKADAFVAVSGEYNHSVIPGLANMLDYFLKEYLWRPSAIV